MPTVKPERRRQEAIRLGHALRAPSMQASATLNSETEGLPEPWMCYTADAKYPA